MLSDPPDFDAQHVELARRLVLVTQRLVAECRARLRHAFFERSVQPEAVVAISVHQISIES